MGLFVQCIFDLHYFYGSLSVPQACAGTAGDELFLAAARYHQRCDSGEPRHTVYRAGFAELKRWCQGRDEVSVERYHDSRCGSSCGIIGIFVWVWIKGPKFQGKIRWYLNVPLIALVIVLFTGATNLALAKRVLSSYFVNIAFAYQDYGYPYCLAVTLFDTGISEPNGYSEQLVKQIETSEGEQKEDDTVKPNIIFLQLESFFDPELVNFLNISEDPIPYYRQLMKDYSSGYLRVPVVGAGTANTEFETISGMSLRYFGAGEYPYKSVLSEETCESAPYVLKNLGYATHAIHNNEANFYSRRSVFSRLGFDTFTSEEYMPDISDVTATGWVKDHILTKEIIKTLDATDEPDYIYTISVQGHGDYPTEPVLDDPEITVTGAEDREKIITPGNIM